MLPAQVFSTNRDTLIQSLQTKPMTKILQNSYMAGLKVSQVTWIIWVNLCGSYGCMYGSSKISE